MSEMFFPIELKIVNLFLKHFYTALLNETGLKNCEKKSIFGGFFRTKRCFISEKPLESIKFQYLVMFTYVSQNSYTYIVSKNCPANNMFSGKVKKYEIIHE